MEKENLVRPSILASDFQQLGKELQEMINLGISHVHYDVMDGQFVPEISFGESVFRFLNQAFGDRIIFDVHLMTLTPMQHIRQFAEYGCKEICFHYEVMTLSDIAKMNQIRQEFPDLKIGLALAPETKVEEIASLLGMFDYYLVMTVVQGMGGQGFISGMEDKVAQLVALREQNHYSYLVGVDGGINGKTVHLVNEKKVDYVVTGSYYFKNPDKRAVLASLKDGR